MPGHHPRVVEYCYEAFQVKQASLAEYSMVMISMDIYASEDTSLQQIQGLGNQIPYICSLLQLSYKISKTSIYTSL